MTRNNIDAHSMFNHEEVNPGELSFGIELEFLFYFKDPRLDGDWQDPEAFVVDEEEELALPPPVVLPDDIDYIEDMYDHWDPDDESGEGGDEDAGPYGAPTKTPRSWTTGLIEEAILSVPGARLERSRTPLRPPHRDMYVVTEPRTTYSGWTVKRDGSVYDDSVSVRGYRCLDFEIASPALWDRPQSHRHVLLVVQELINRFRLRVNLSTGFHCHVGAGVEAVGDELLGGQKGEALAGGARAGGGADLEGTQAEEGVQEQQRMGGGLLRVRMAKHPLGVFKRAAALMWAADGFLAQAFPPERGLSDYAPPIGLCSRLAHGVQIRYYHDAEHRLCAREQPLPDPPPPTPPPDISPLPRSSLPSSRLPRLLSGRHGHSSTAAPTRTKFLSILRTNTVPPDAQARYDFINPHRTRVHKNPGRLARGVGVRAGVAHLMACRNRAEVASLFEPPTDAPFYARTNYNLQSYRVDGVADTSKPAATVEFREAPGSLEPEWIVTWLRVCLGFFRFARDASGERWWAVVERLAEAEERAKAVAEEGGGFVEEEGVVGRENVFMVVGDKEEEEFVMVEEEGEEEEDDSVDGDPRNNHHRGKSAQGYDVISLLTDMGLFAEALFLERKLCCNDPLQFWYPCRLAEVSPHQFEDDVLPEPTVPKWASVKTEGSIPLWGGPQVRSASRAGDDDDDDDGDAASSNASSPFVPTPTWVWDQDNRESKGATPDTSEWGDPPVYDETVRW